MRFPGWLTLAGPNILNNPSPVTIAFWDLLDPLPENSREVTFDEPVSAVSFFFAYQATAGFPNIALEAFDAAGNLVATASASGNVVVLNQFVVWDPLGVDVGQNMITKVRITGRRLHSAIDDFTACRIVVVTATIDIKPADDANEVDLDNPINLNSRGELPVAILTSLNFDALTVDENVENLCRAVGYPTAGRSRHPLPRFCLYATIRPEWFHPYVPFFDSSLNQVPRSSRYLPTHPLPPDLSGSRLGRLSREPAPQRRGELRGCHGVAQQAESSLSRTQL